jgi:hypothetical protein
MKGSLRAMKLYTIDIDFTQLKPIPDRYGLMSIRKRREVLSNEMK